MGHLSAAQVAYYCLVGPAASLRPECAARRAPRRLRTARLTGQYHLIYCLCSDIFCIMNLTKSGVTSDQFLDKKGGKR